MPVHSVKYITNAVIALLEEGFIAAGYPNVKVLPDPPAKNQEDGIGFYLFHMQQSGHHNNFPPPGKDQPNVRYMPLPLNLYYQLTANFDTSAEDGSDTYEEQDMISIAMNILHGYPEVNDRTELNGVNIFDKVEGLDTNDVEPDISNRKNRIKISLLPIAYNDAVHYWTAGQMPMKCAAYYEVCQVFLEPEKPKTYAGRVLRYGNFVFPEGAPRITQSKNILEFGLPPDGAAIQQVNVQPAQAPYGGTIDFLGAGFSGENPTLLLAHGRWENPATAEDWEVSPAGQGLIRVTVKDQATNREINPPAPVTVLPGLYAARIKVTRRRTLPGGEIRQFEHISNQYPITVLPFIESVTESGGLFTVTGNIFQHPELREEDVQVYLGERRLERVAAPIQPGEFRTLDGETLEFRLPAPVPDEWESGQFVPLRILINGAESPPNWVEVP